MRVTDKYIYFWGEWPSNWFPCFFNATYDGKEYKFYNSEQYFMFIKAMTFGDVEIANEIIARGKNPKTAKALGRKVKNYDDKVWNEKRYQVMVDANMLKFSQSKMLTQLLFNKELKGKHFCEASPLDTIWGDETDTRHNEMKSCETMCERVTDGCDCLIFDLIYIIKIKRSNAKGSFNDLPDLS